MKRNKRELGLCMARYLIFGDDYLLNDQQKDLVKPYTIKIKAAYKITKVKHGLAKAIKTIDKMIIFLAEKTDGFYSACFNKSLGKLESDPKFAQNIYNKVIDELQDLEDEN